MNFLLQLKWGGHRGCAAIPAVVFSLFMAGTRCFADELDSAYHNSDEILAELKAYAEDYPEWMTLDSIGHGAEFGKPIWMAKLSDNPDKIEPEAALLFIGQVHAEEVVGVETVLEIMRQMLDHNDENLFRQRLEGLEIYLIPTANPEGLDIVYSGMDITFRKNCRDNIGDGQLRIVDGEGWDTSGVDLNRNFGTHWDRGDTLFRPEENLRYNGYRGSAPFSEPESQALRDLALQRPFLFSIVYHGSRTGNSNEMLIAPWFWRENNIIKRPPDYLAINALGERVAGMLPKMRDRGDHYRPAQSMQRKGQLQDWFYVETGCIQYMDEVAADIHPDADTMRMVVADNLPAVWYLMDLALGLEGLDGFGTLTVIANPGATVTIDGATHPILAPRRTCAENGRFDWLLPAGEHSVEVSMLGASPQSWGNYEIPDGERTVLEVELESDLNSIGSFGLRQESPTDAALAYLDICETNFNYKTATTIDTSDVLLNLVIPLGTYQFLARSDGYLPVPASYEVRGDIYLRVSMPLADTAYFEDFSSDQGWQRTGNDWGITTFDGRSCFTESKSGDYANDANIYLELNEIIEIDTLRATLRIIHLPYCEPGDDYQEIEWWTNPDDVHAKRYSQLRRMRSEPGGDVPDWDTLYVSLDSLEAGNLVVRFREVSDHETGEDGWLIDQVAVFVEGYKEGVSDFIPYPSSLILSCYPNPFNSSVTINFALPEGNQTCISVYDLQGREVAVLVNDSESAGFHTTNWSANDASAGIFFVRMAAPNFSRTQRLVLVK